MKKIITLMFALSLTTVVALTQAARASQDGEMMKKKSKTEKAAAAPASDADIQKCISDKFAKSKTITNGAVTVSSGQATLTGEAKNGGAKGGGVKSAKACGAKTVVNNLTIPETAKGEAKASDRKKAEPAKK
jgi:hypothetical protein